MNIKSLIAREQPLYTRAGQQIIPSTLGASSAVISRSLCLYQCFSLQSIPLKERKAALRLKVMQWAPYRDYGTYIIWDGVLAQVWLWKQQIRQQVHQSYTVETAHYPVLEQNGMRLLQCAEGFEAQYWQKGVLLNSHWWIAEPNANAWLKFQRATGQQPTEKMPTVTSLGMRLKAWKKGETLNPQQTLPIEIWVWKGIVLIPLIIATWTITETILLKQQLERAEAINTQLSQQINPTLLAKTETTHNQQKAKILASLFNKTTQIEYIDQFLQAFSAKKELRIISWIFAGNSLTIVTQSDTLDPSWVVKKITEIGWVNTISTSNAGRQGQMKMSIKIKEDVDEIT